MEYEGGVDRLKAFKAKLSRLPKNAGGKHKRNYKQCANCGKR